jgi:hypothetical protein
MGWCGEKQVCSVKLFEITVRLYQDGAGQNPNFSQPPSNKFRALVDLCGTNTHFNPFQLKLEIY